MGMLPFLANQMRLVALLTLVKNKTPLAVIRQYVLKGQVWCKQG
jgi:hypothetical protein